VIDVETADRVGLLYTLSRTLSELQLDIASAKIRTEIGAAMDSFYVRQVGVGKITDPERLQTIERRLRDAIQKMDVVAAH
jgi:[protein-PII] uridylyltransferase